MRGADNIFKVVIFSRNINEEELKTAATMETEEDDVAWVGILNSRIRNKVKIWNILLIANSNIFKNSLYGKNAPFNKFSGCHCLMFEKYLYNFF